MLRLATLIVLPLVCELAVTEDILLSQMETLASKQPVSDPLPNGVIARLDAGSLVAFTPDSKRIVTGGHKQPITVWDASTGKKLRQLSGGPLESERILVAPDGKTLAVDHQGQPWLYDLQTGRLRRRISFGGLDVENEDYRDISSIDMTPDGKAILSAFVYDPTIRFWDTQTGKQVREFVVGKRDQVRVYHQALSPNGRLLAVAYRKPRWPGNGNYVAVFNLATGKRLYAARAAQDRSDLFFSPDSRMLVTEFGCWEAATGMAIHLLFGDQPWSGQIAFSPDGRLLACGGAGGKFRIVDVATFETVREVGGHDQQIECFAFSPDGARLATGSKDGSALIWDVKKLCSPLPKLPVGNLEQSWQDLLSTNAARGHYAVWSLVAAPKRSTPFLAKRMPPAPPRLDPKLVAQFIQDLGDKRFGVREKAMARLRDWGWEVGPALRKALNSKPPSEVQLRLEEILASLRDRPPLTMAEIRKMRAVAALERIASPEACQVLEKLAGGAPGAVETNDAQEALKRLSAKELCGR